MAAVAEARLFRMGPSVSPALDLNDYLRAVAALAAVLALALAAAWALRQWAGGALALTGRGPRRLTVSEVLVLDPRRRLVLVRRDQVEHLLLLGATEEQVVERDITPPRPPTSDPAAALALGAVVLPNQAEAGP